MFRLWADVYDSNWVKSADCPGPIVLAQAQISRVLDGMGSISLEPLATDTRALEFLTNEARVRIYILDHTGARREIGRGIITDVNKGDASGGRQLRVGGPDSLDEFRRQISFDQYKTATALNTIISDIVAKISWSANVESSVASDLKIARFDGTNLLKALRRLAGENGLHFRQDLNAAIASPGITFGPLGQAATFRAVNYSIPNAFPSTSDEIAIITSISLVSKSESVINYVYPFGAGEGEAALTLKHATLSGYTSVQDTTNDGRTIYGLKNEASIALYGESKKALTFKEIGPLTNSGPAIVLAANALHDATTAFLDRNGDPKTVYRVSLIGHEKTIQPGDKITVAYHGGVVDQDGREISTENITGEFWVLKVNENFSLSGATLQLEISPVDDMIRDLGDVVIGSLDSITTRSLRPMIFPSFITFTYYDTIQGYFDRSITQFVKTASFRLVLPNAVVDLINVSLNFRTFPLYSSTSVGHVGGLPNLAGTIHRGVNHPRGISIKINGVDQTSALGGKWNPSTNAPFTSPTLDITEYIRDEDDPNAIFTTHTIEFDVDAGPDPEDIEYPGMSTVTTSSGVGSQGWVEVTFSILAVAQAIVPEA